MSLNRYIQTNNACNNIIIGISRLWSHKLLFCRKCNIFNHTSIRFLKSEFFSLQLEIFDSLQLVFLVFSIRFTEASCLRACLNLCIRSFFKFQNASLLIDAFASQNVALPPIEERRFSATRYRRPSYLHWSAAGRWYKPCPNMPHSALVRFIRSVSAKLTHAFFSGWSSLNGIGNNTGYFCGTVKQKRMSRCVWLQNGKGAEPLIPILKRSTSQHKNISKKMATW